MTRSPRDLANQKIQLRKQQETLLRDLLTVVDALDRAADHWHQAEGTPRPVQSPLAMTWWQRWRQWLSLCPLIAPSPQPDQSATRAEVVTSARQGIDMIRESMLTVLSQHQIVPLPSQGHPFDPTQMHALGQQVDAHCAPNMVVQEVVRGYRWQDRVLREAQVIVAVPPGEE
ncbi:nucleotide exchange factor GrpE [Nodosilinea sp. LEGE 07088]|uniref:nucleotide exchange factor GrpE n=1 Tax=Nodosilinea sp. LEGE 07088 TaxID=2777968 RepID=UPI001881926E|nr:nucleotide exchange factor GrpE [Nodosilinea sp. LEGE 07088]MBE9137875.1 nucleotide exchange factor GrpE [Nodosilinea sp. LEGE 07088]